MFVAGNVNRKQVGLARMYRPVGRPWGLRTVAVIVAAVVAVVLAVSAASGGPPSRRIVLHERVEGLACFRCEPTREYYDDCRGKAGKSRVEQDEDEEAGEDRR